MIETVLTWLVEQVYSWGYIGIFVMMFLESTFFPFPSEVAMIPAGFLAYQGKMNAYLAVFAGLLGSLLGAIFNYYLARVVGIPVLRRYGRFILFDEAKLQRCNELFSRHGEIATFVCRLIPLIRQYISLPAGIAGMNLFRFGLYTSLGAGIWVAILTVSGYFIGQTLSDLQENPTWRDLEGAWKQYETPVLIVVGLSMGLLVAGYLMYNRGRRNAKSRQEQLTENPPDNVNRDNINNVNATGV